MNRNLRDLLMFLSLAVLYLASVYLLLEALLVPAWLALAVAVVTAVLAIVILRMLMATESHTREMPVAMLYIVPATLLLCAVVAQIIVAIGG